MFKKLMVVLATFTLLIPSSYSLTYLKENHTYDLINKNQNENDIKESDNLQTEIYSKGKTNPVIGEYQILDKRSNDAIKDSYEDNNSISYATQLSPNFSLGDRPYNYYKTIRATLHRNEWLGGLIKREVDEDYYYFDLYGKADVDIRMTNIPQGCDYDLELYAYRNSKYVTENDIITETMSKFINNQDERMHGRFFPNRYFIKVNSFKNTFNAQLPYTLSLDVKYVSEDISIPKLRYEKDVRAAMWVSDFDPAGVKPFQNYGEVFVGDRNISEVNSSYTFANPFINNIPFYKNITHASLYVWDIELRKVLFIITNDIINQLKEKLQANQTLRMKLKALGGTLESNDEITGISYTILTSTGLLQSSGLIDLSLLGLSLTVKLVSSVLNFVVPEDVIVKQKELLSYLYVLRAALEVGYNSSNTEIIKIDSIYNFKSTVTNFHTDYIVDFTPRIQDNYKYNYNMISAFNNNDIFSGTIYPLKDELDYKFALRKQLFEQPDINTGGNTTLVEEYPLAQQIMVGEYKWYNFTAPEDGIYTFQTYSDIDTYGEFFYKIVPGYSTNNKIKTNDDFESNRNFKLDFPLNKGRTVFLRVSTFKYSYSGLYSLLVKKTNELNSHSETIADNFFEFEGSYNKETQKKTLYTSSQIEVNTERLRTGFIENKYLTLSARNISTDNAYLKITTNKNLFKLKFDLGLWSNREYIDNNSKIDLYVIDQNNYNYLIESFDIKNLSKNKDHLDTFEYNIKQHAKGFMLKVTTEKVNYSTNKGRVVISNINLSYL